MTQNTITPLLILLRSGYKSNTDRYRLKGWRRLLYQIINY
jgi:hypothetical protein